ncbi:MAG: ABC transporter ATP-binding protein [Clostridia bacterium]|nr:ABC transporter ATP-binding protein [Clostridia bacterium]
MIRLEHVTYHYKEKERANLGGISLEISEGEFIVIAGKSGCGKTTLAKCINGLIPHFEEGYLEGNIRIKGKNTKELQIGQIGAATGSVFQDPRSQFFTTTVFDELVFGCRNAGLPREEILRRIDMTLKELGIEKLRDRSLFSLSSGGIKKNSSKAERNGAYDSGVRTQIVLSA